MDIPDEIGFCEQAARSLPYRRLRLRGDGWDLDLRETGNALRSRKPCRANGQDCQLVGEETMAGPGPLTR